MVPEEILERAAVDDVSPRYLRKQKAANATRRRLRRAASPVRRVAIALCLVIVTGATIGGLTWFLLFSPAMLLHPAQVEVSGTRYVSHDEIASVFSADMGRSVIRVPLEQRLASIEKIPWVRRAAVERVLPNRLNVAIVERAPVAFLSTNAGLKLIDADGVILDRPQGAHFNLPVVGGLNAATPAAERARRLGMFSEFLEGIETVLPGADAGVSEANLSNPDDVQATLAGLAVLARQGPVAVHFGDADFAYRFRLFLGNFADWRAAAGNVEAVDLRYDGQALVTPVAGFSTGGLAGAATPAPTAPLSAQTGQVAAQERPVSASGKNRKGSARR